MAGLDAMGDVYKERDRFLDEHRAALFDTNGNSRRASLEGEVSRG